MGKHLEISHQQYRDMRDELTQLRAQLATATERIAELEDEKLSLDACVANIEALEGSIETLKDDLTVNKNAYSVWYERCLVVEAERDKLREALEELKRKFFSFYVGAGETDSGLQWKDASEYVEQAAALMGDGDKEEDGDGIC